MRKRILIPVLLASVFAFTACESISHEDECSLESLFTSSWWRLCV